MTLKEVKSKSKAPVPKPPRPPRPTRSSLSAYALEHDLELLFFDPPEYFDHAILGLVYGFGQEPAVLYDEELVLAAMSKDMGEEDAREWFEYNTVGAFLGESTPRFLIRPEPLVEWKPS